MRSFEQSSNHPAEREQTEKNPELRRAFTGAVLKWMEALISREPREIRELLKGLSRSKKLGAALVVSSLFAALEGCGGTIHEIVECSDDETRFNSTVVDWLIDHPEEIQKQFNILWPKGTISAKQLTNTLAAANIECGLEIDGNKYHGSTDYKSFSIIIDVGDLEYQKAMEDLKTGAWTQDFTLNELTKQIQTPEDFNVVADYELYFLAIAYGAQVAAHEAAHLAFDTDHSGEVKSQIEKIEETEGELSAEDLESLDQIYAWGFAAQYAVDNYGDETAETLWERWQQVNDY